MEQKNRGKGIERVNKKLRCEMLFGELIGKLWRKKDKNKNTTLNRCLMFNGYFHFDPKFSGNFPASKILRK